MGIRINTNVAALVAQRHLAGASARVSRSLERLSSGQRINRSADDPAGFAISERLRARMRALDVGARNAADGISMLQIADGGLESMSELLIRLTELTEQAMNGTITVEQRAFLDVEFQALVAEIDRIAVSQEFNGRHLLDGTGGDAGIRVGEGAGIALGLGQAFTAAALGLDVLSLAGDPGSWTVQPLTALAAAQRRISSGRASFGASQSRLESAIRLLQNQHENLAAADSRIRDVDYAAEMSELTSARILQQVAVAVLAQAQRQPALALRLLGIR